MGLIDLRKLNAEVDKLIAETERATKEMVEAYDLRFEKMHDQMMEDLKPYADLVMEVKPLDSINVEAGTCQYGCGDWKMFLVFNRWSGNCHINIMCIRQSDGFGSFEGYLDLHNDIKQNRRHMRQYGPNIETVVKTYFSERDQFEYRFTEEMTKAIKEKAAKANCDHEEAARRLKEV